jgi:hypothetical protein
VNERNILNPSNESNSGNATEDITENFEVQKAAGQYMIWSQVSLLSLESVLSACPTYDYTLIIDKSCSDAIACGEDIEVSVPFPLRKRLKLSDNLLPAILEQQDMPKSWFVHPLNILALHLALVTPPRARWIAVSYSVDRFSFITPPHPSESSLPTELCANGFPLPSDYWSLVRKETIAIAQPSDQSSNEVIHRPPISHWIYVFERTEMELQL